MASIRLYLDTNVFISAFENNDDLARKLLELISLNENAKSPFLATSEMTLAELMVDPFRKNNDRLIEIYDNLTLGNAFIRVGNVSRDVLWHAALLRAEHASLRLPDAIHLSTAMHFGCAYFLTSDTRLKAAYSITSNRHTFAGLNAQISTTKPTIPVLDRIIRELAK